MASQQLNDSFETALKSINIAFMETEKAIRKSKAALNSAECRLRNAKSEIRRVLASLKEDVTINISLNDETVESMFLDFDSNEYVKQDMDDSGILANIDNSSDYGGTTDECEGN
eukprot:Seg8426.2 transcript_id=Seg8426.2/GoldUCD/mRNA.D3Y31 product="hypothetical protein" protein_id=Seg8426.2/GoldUCD/D3Y31